MLLCYFMLFKFSLISVLKFVGNYKFQQLFAKKYRIFFHHTEQWMNIALQTFQNLFSKNLLPIKCMSHAWFMIKDW